MKVMRAPTKPEVDAHAPDASLWVRVRVRAQQGVWLGGYKHGLTRSPGVFCLHPRVHRTYSVPRRVLLTPKE